jgi:predicted negative regulator of RcsB-dependent stress response
MAEETQNIDQEMKKTDIGQWVYENKKLILSLVLATVVFGISYAVYNKQQTKQMNESLTEIHQFSKDVADPYLKGELDEAAFISKWQSLPAHILNQPSIVPTLFEVISKLEKTNPTESIAILEKLKMNFANREKQIFFIHLKLASLLEENGQKEKALESYNSILTNGFNPIESKVYLHIGRLNKELGSMEKAKENFNFIISKFPNSEEAKYAKLYLLK